MMISSQSYPDGDLESRPEEHHQQQHHRPPPGAPPYPHPGEVSTSKTCTGAMIPPQIPPSSTPHTQMITMGKVSSHPTMDTHCHNGSSSTSGALDPVLQGINRVNGTTTTTICSDHTTTPHSIHNHNQHEHHLHNSVSPRTQMLSGGSASSGAEQEVVSELDVEVSLRGRRASAKFHCHGQRPGLNRTALYQLTAVSSLCFLFMIGEFIGGTLSNSLALITDATHLASDVMGFLVSLFAIWVAAKPPSVRMSFGYYRAEVLGALISILIIWITTGVLVYLAVCRVIDPDFDIDANTMLVTAGAGVVFNIIMGLVLNLSDRCAAVAHAHGGHGHSHDGHSHLDDLQDHSQQQHQQQHHSHISNSQSHHPLQNCEAHPDSFLPKRVNNNLNQDSCHNGSDTSDEDMLQEASPSLRMKHININVRAAFIHIIGDLIQSIGVFIAALIIKFKPDFKMADPICTFIFSILVLITTVTILRDTILVILEAVPRGMDYRMCKFDMERLEGVLSVHSLNAWTLTPGKRVFTVHLAVGPDTDRRDLLERSITLLRDKYSSFHTTVQIEDYDYEVMTSCEDCVGPKLL